MIEDVTIDAMLNPVIKTAIIIPKIMYASTNDIALSNAPSEPSDEFTNQKKIPIKMPKAIAHTTEIAVQIIDAIRVLRLLFESTGFSVVRIWSAAIEDN